MKLRYAFLFSIITLFFVLGPSKPTLLARRMGNAPVEIKAKVMALEQETGFDVMTGIISKPFSSKATLALLEILSGDDVPVQMACLRFLKEIIRQQEVPPKFLSQKIQPAVNRFLKYHAASDKQSLSIQKEGENLLWDVEVKSASSETSRIALLKKSLNQMSNKYRSRRHAAIDYLVQMDNAQARKVLEDRLRQLRRDKKRTLFKEDIERIREELDRLQLKQDLRMLSKRERIRRLRSWFRNPKSKQRSGRHGSRKWFIDELEKQDGKEAEKVLKDIWKEKSYDRVLRYRAQEALIRRGDLKPKERTIRFQ